VSSNQKKYMNHDWIEYSEYYMSQCVKCSAKKFKERNHGDYIWVYYTDEHPFGSLESPKCKKIKKYIFQAQNNFKDKIYFLPSVSFIYGKLRGGYIITIEWLWLEVSITILK
jgi:hypothetical protein